MFPMTVTINDQAQLNAVMAALVANSHTPAPPKAAPSKAVTTPKANTAPKANTTPKAEPPPAPASLGVEYETALIALKDMAVEHGRASVTHVLGRFGVTNLSHLDPARFPEVTQACKDYPLRVEAAPPWETTPPKAAVNAGVSS